MVEFNTDTTKLVYEWVLFPLQKRQWGVTYRSRSYTKTAASHKSTLGWVTYSKIWKLGECCAMWKQFNRLKSIIFRQLYLCGLLPGILISLNVTLISLYRDMLGNEIPSEYVHVQVLLEAILICLLPEFKDLPIGMFLLSLKQPVVSRASKLCQYILLFILPFNMLCHSEISLKTTSFNLVEKHYTTIQDVFPCIYVIIPIVLCNFLRHVF